MSPYAAGNTSMFCLVRLPFLKPFIRDHFRQKLRSTELSLIDEAELKRLFGEVKEDLK